MDSRARIEYALFHLTPTRTRCDLLVFANGQSEKLASGLLQPFLLHLKCAKDQIEKGGYSITLAPPAAAAWFTKATLQRFVRFVSSPDVLERFVTIEKEIEQIEEFIRSNELPCEEVDANGKEAASDVIHTKATSAAEVTDEIEGTNSAANEEHSKVQLRRVLETRKAVLHKEQAMAYARALVTGFQTNHLDALLSFAITFGASRLREACYGFIKLCNKKNQDRLWIAEVAAMQASSKSQLSCPETSGILLADDENDSGLQLPASDQVEGNGKPQPSSPWPNSYIQYFPSYYGPVHPHNVPPYQGYPFPGTGMHVGNPYCSENMVPGTRHDGKPSDGRKKNSARKKEKSPKEEVPDTSGEDFISGSSSDELSEESMDGGKKRSSKKKTKKENGKKSSKRVVIRNINYISSKKGNDNVESSSDDDDDLFNGDSIKQQIEEAVGSLHKNSRRKKQLDSKHAGSVNGSNGLNLGNPDAKKFESGEMSESWGAFQNLLLRDQEISLLSSQRAAGSDSFVVGRDDGRDDEYQRHPENFNVGDNFRPFVKNSNDTDEMVMFSRGNEDPGNFIRTTQSDYAARSAIVNSKSGEDWYVTPMNGSSFPDHSSDQKVLKGEYASVNSSSTWMDRVRNDIVDDSFMVHAQEHKYDSGFKTDLSTVLDITEVIPQQTDAAENLQSTRESCGAFEPDDLYMVLDRSSSHEPFSASWTPEINYENIIKESETGKNSSVGEPKAEDDEIAKVKGKGARRSKALGGPLGKSKSEISSKCRKPSPANKTTVRKTKQDLEEERRLRMETLLIQRQKRIAERNSNSVISSPSNKETGNIKRTLKSEKPPLKSLVQDKKPIVKPSTVDRLAAARISKQVSVAQSKMIQTRKQSPKAAGEQKHGAVNGTTKPALSMKKEKHLDKKNRLPSKSNKSENVDNAEISTLPEADDVPSPAPVLALAVDSHTKGKNSDDPESLNSDISDKKDSLVLPVEITSLPAPVPSVDATVKESQIPLDENKEKMLSHSEVYISTYEVAAEGKTISDAERSHLKVPVQKQCSMEKATLSKDNDSIAPSTKQAKAPSVTFSPTTKVSEIPASTPPSSIGFSPEHIPSRKNWDNKDYYSSNSAKVARGFKKLLMLGRKSRPISYA